MVKTGAKGTRNVGSTPSPAYIIYDILIIVFAWPLAEWISWVLGRNGTEAALGTAILGASPWSPEIGAVLFVQSLALPLSFGALGQYDLHRNSGPWWSYQRVLMAWTFQGLAVLALLFILGVQSMPRAIMALDFVIILLASAGWRAVKTAKHRQRLRRGEGLLNTLFVGMSPEVESAAKAIVDNSAFGRRIVGFATEQTSELDSLSRAVGNHDNVWTSSEGKLEVAAQRNLLEQPLHLIGYVSEMDTKQILDAVDALCAEEILLSPEVDRELVTRVIRGARERGVSVNLIPRHFHEIGGAPQPWGMGDFMLLGLHMPPFSVVGRLVKRTVDVFGSMVGILVTSPVVLLAGLAIKIENPRSPVFYRGERIGYKGRHFRQWKFSTMEPNADQLRPHLDKKNAREGPWFKLAERDDPRISNVGRFLRRYSLNDIPQFFNVLSGDMSLVGPRPLAPDEASQFIQYDLRYYRIFDVKPGITGLWQISDRNNPSFQYRFEKDFQYIQGWSIWRDVRILLLTPFAMLRPEK